MCVHVAEVSMYKCMTFCYIHIDQPQLHTVSSQVSMELADPIDYEKFISENSKILEEDPHREMLVVPEDDVSVTTLPRKFRTVEIPVPGNAK